MKKIIYNSSRTPILSNSIPLDFYDSFVFVQKILRQQSLKRVTELLNDKEKFNRLYAYRFILKNPNKEQILESTLKFINEN